MNILVTGGAGYIGSHAVKYLQRAGHRVVVLDNLSRGHRRAITGEAVLVAHDLKDRGQIVRVLRANDIDCVMHFAALAYVGESVQEPLRYYQNNTACALNLLDAMHECGVSRFVFSSTCATYGEPDEDRIPISEDCPQQPINPYGRSKLMLEQMLLDHAAVNDDFRYAILRYFNVAGCDREGEIGEAHVPETHLIPIVLEVAAGERPHVVLFGTDYPTPDGTCIRDYIHVEDLIDAHIAAMDAMDAGHPRQVYNLGIGRGCSVREIIDVAAEVTGRAIPVEPGPRRPGDPPVLYADPSAIRAALGWSARITDLHEIIDSAWRWKQSMPTGYIGGEQLIRF